MTIESILIVLIIGGLAGWLAGIVFQGAGFGIAGDIIIGVIGGFVGSWLLGELGVSMPGGQFVAAVLTALVGALVLIFVIMLFRRVFWQGGRLRL